jgi:hypothetical protein
MSNPRRRLLPLCMLVMIAAGAPAHSGSSPDATRQQEPAFIDSNGLEVDGAGSVESPVEPDIVNLTLFTISVILVLGVLAMGVIDQHRSRPATSDRSKQTQGDATS